MLQTLAAIVTSIVGVLGSLTTIVMLMAGLANANPGQVQQGKWMMLGVALMQVFALAGVIYLLVKHKPGPAMVVGILPLVVVIVLVVVLVKIEW